MKKCFVLMFGIFMLAALAACGGTTPAGSGGAAAAPDADVVAEGGVVTVWCWDPAFNIASMLEAESVYQQINPGFTLEISEVPWDDIQTRLITMGMAGSLGDLPDIFLIQDNALEKNVTDFPDIFVDLTDSGIDFNLFAPAKVNYSVINGRNFAVPFDNGVTITALRTDILAEAGLTIDDFTDITWERFIELGIIVQQATGHPLVSNNANSPDLVSIMLKSAGASLFHPDGSVNIVGNDILVETVETLIALRDSGVMMLINNWDEYIASFTHGTVAGTVQGCWIIGSIVAIDDTAGNWAITNTPRLSRAPGATNFSVAGGSSWAISNNGNDPSLAISFLANTFAGSVAFYENILPNTGALSAFLPAADSPVYMEPHPFFGGQPVFMDITRFAANVPSFAPGVFYYEARDAVGVAMQRIIQGLSMEQALQEAEDEVLFHMN